MSSGGRFALVRGAERVVLRMERARRGSPAGVVPLELTVPRSAAVGLWDLCVAHGDQRFRVPHAVAVQDSAQEEIRIACVGDWHLLPPDCDEPGSGLLRRYVRLVDELNALSVDGVIHLGDVITRYAADKSPRPARLIRWQMEAAGDILGRLKMPVFVLRGNHDMAFESCRTAWGVVFGNPALGGTDDSVRVLGPCRLVMMDGFAFYDMETRETTMHSLSEAQLKWLETQCTGPRTEPWRVLVLHYDYAHQVLPRLRELGIDMFVYGHAGPVEDNWFVGPGVDIRNVNVSTGAAYRIITATRERLETGPPVGY